MADTDSEVYAYRAICSHGKVRMMTVDKPEYAKDVARELASAVRHGCTIDRVTVEEARKSELTCLECDKIKVPKRQRDV